MRVLVVSAIVVCLPLRRCEQIDNAKTRWEKAINDTKPLPIEFDGNIGAVFGPVPSTKTTNTNADALATTQLEEISRYSLCGVSQLTPSKQHTKHNGPMCSIEMNGLAGKQTTHTKKRFVGRDPLGSSSTSILCVWNCSRGAFSASESWMRQRSYTVRAQLDEQSERVE